MRTDAIIRLFAARKHLIHASSLANAPRLDDIARHAGMSPAHFLRQFRATFGETPRQVAIDVRLRRAAHLLRTTDLSVTEICFESGYESLGSFSFLFRRETGCSPREFRRDAQPQRRFWPVNLQFLDRFIPLCLLDGFSGAKKSNIREVSGQSLC